MSEKNRKIILELALTNISSGELIDLLIGWLIGFDLSPEGAASMRCSNPTFSHQVQPQILSAKHGGNGYHLIWDKTHNVPISGRTLYHKTTELVRKKKKCFVVGG